jgi:hypothetical protein
MRLWVGVVTFVVGAVVWFVTGAPFGPRRPVRAPWIPRLGLALSSLGLSVLASTRPGLSWSISSICFSLIAIILLVWVLRDNLRR